MSQKQNLMGRGLGGPDPDSIKPGQLYRIVEKDGELRMELQEEPEEKIEIVLTGQDAHTLKAWLERNRGVDYEVSEDACGDDYACELISKYRLREYDGREINRMMEAWYEE